MAFGKCRVESVENPSPPLRAHGNFELPRKIDVISVTRCMQPSLHERSMQAVDFLKITARRNIEWHMCCPQQVPDYETNIGPSMPCRRTPPRISTKSGHEVYSQLSARCKVVSCTCSLCFQACVNKITRLSSRSRCHQHGLQQAAR